MYIENDLKWHSTPLLNFISFIKISRLPTEDENARHQFLTKIFVIYEYFDEKFSSPNSESRGVQNAENNNALSPIRLEISIEKINELLQHKQLCAADVRCLDSNSKQCLTKLCLQNCLTRQ